MHSFRGGRVSPLRVENGVQYGSMEYRDGEDDEDEDDLPKECYDPEECIEAEDLGIDSFGRYADSDSVEDYELGVGEGDECGTSDNIHESDTREDTDEHSSVNITFPSSIVSRVHSQFLFHRHNKLEENVSSPISQSGQVGPGHKQKISHSQFHYHRNNKTEDQSPISPSARVGHEQNVSGSQFHYHTHERSEERIRSPVTSVSPLSQVEYEETESESLSFEDNIGDEISANTCTPSPTMPLSFEDNIRDEIHVRANTRSPTTPLSPLILNHQDSLDDMLSTYNNPIAPTSSPPFLYYRQNKLDEALLSSGRFSDAVQSLLEWLGKAEAYLAEDQPILGDLDTVGILTEQHKVRYNNATFQSILFYVIFISV